VNKSVFRFAANIPLLRNNLCPLSFVDVPERAYIDGWHVPYYFGCIKRDRKTSVA
jgi:hypothetical protein